jgi:hypothetical protein
MDVWIDGWMDRWVGGDGRMDGWLAIDRQLDGWMDGLMDEWMECLDIMAQTCRLVLVDNVINILLQVEWISIVSPWMTYSKRST